MNLSTVTSYAEVRAILGVSEEELEDTELDTPAWSTEVLFKVLDISPVAMPTYETVTALPVADRTELQQRFFLVYRLFCAYSFAEVLFNSLPMFAFRQVTDGKAEATRFESLETVGRGIASGTNTARLRLRQILTAMGLESTGSQVSAGPTMLAAVTLGVNPVTNS
jgi:hypothetical protein